ncbi:hypothetical protein Rin_00003790 [Candidatus Regiella insecticola 5.15]|uniref:Uncharacterized protein n=1 Tax=Candidatus Regiella insecticola 5.15 TaxID=1005043 RepID=G2GX89_9ENTR|nr:hypothetical protein [Candidatus Regiella insecticola]EGY29642.1 hypothetical protein Rin_00003790 [Candidatus Regiella insecticola 5.15]
MSVDRLRDSASTRSQRRRNLKGEGYRHTMRAMARSQQRGGFKGEGYKSRLITGIRYTVHIGSKNRYCFL